MNKLGLEVVREVYRLEKDSYKLDLALNGNYVIELFSFPNAPGRPSYPEAQGLRHVAFEVESITDSVKVLSDKGIHAEKVRVGPSTNKT